MENTQKIDDDDVNNIYDDTKYIFRVLTITSVNFILYVKTNPETCIKCHIQDNVGV